MINQPNSVDQPILTNQEKMVKGSAWMTASNIISRMLGAIYIIPWYAWMGEHGNEAASAALAVDRGHQAPLAGLGASADWPALN